MEVKMAELLFRLFWMLVATMVSDSSLEPKMKPYIFGELAAFTL